MFETLSAWPDSARFFFAFVAVLALIALTAWVVRRFGASRLGGNTRGRQPRLAVIDAASVDGRRRLVLVRRDNIEHLVMIGGPTDVVIEPNIVRAAAARDSNRETPRAPVSGDTLPRALPMGDSGAWPLQPVHEPPPPASRPARPAVVDEPWVPANEPGMRARPAETDHAAKPHADFAPPPPPRQAPPPASPVARETLAEPAASPQTDHNLAEMAQRLEAALRRPGASDVHPPVTDPLAMPVKPPAAKVNKPAEPPRTAPEPATAPPLTATRESAAPELPRVASRESAIPEVPRAPEREPRVPAPEVKPAAAAAEKNPFDSLEQEMANLLGRPSGKT